jgi:xylose isomerase
MASGVVKVAVALGIAVVVGYPIRHELQARAAIRHDMIDSLDANDAAALRQWQGSADSFVAMLYDRCMRAHSGDEQACARYRE